MDPVVSASFALGTCCYALSKEQTRWPGQATYRCMFMAPDAHSAVVCMRDVYHLGWSDYPSDSRRGYLISASTCSAIVRTSEQRPLCQVPPCTARHRNPLSSQLGFVTCKCGLQVARFIRGHSDLYTEEYPLREGLCPLLPGSFGEPEGRRLESRYEGRCCRSSQGLCASCRHGISPSPVHTV
jgi:hypothetical protein